MSGRKRATLSLSAEDRRRLESIQERLKEVEQDYAEARRRLQAVRMEDVQRSQQALEERQEHFVQTLQQVNLETATQVAELEAQTNQALREQAQRWQQQVEQAQAAGWQTAWQESQYQTQTLLNEQAGAFAALWAQAQAERQAYFAAQQQRARQVRSVRQRKAWLAQQAYQEALALWTAIERSYDHRRLAPGMLDQLQAELTSAYFNLQNEVYEAALAVAQRTQHALSGLRLQMEQVLARRAALSAAALAQAQLLCDFAQVCAQVPALDLDGQALDVTVDVNLWDQNQQAALAQHAEELCAELEDHAGELDEEVLLAVLQDSLPQLEQALHETVRLARQNVIASEVRFSVAQQVVEALSEQGFTLDEDADYQDGDGRRPYQAVLTSLDGSEVHVRVLAEAQDPLNYILDVDSCDQDQRSEHELRRRTNEVLTSLQAAGLKVTGIYQAEPGAAPPARRRLRDRNARPYQE